jgi:DNA polymerase-1
MLQKTTIALPPIVYCVTYAEAAAGFAGVLQAARGQLIGLDIETAPKPAEAARLEALLAQQAVLKGKTKAAKKCNAPGDELAALKAEAKLLAIQIKYAESAALDPHRGRIRLVQLYAGGDCVVVIDAFKTGERALELLSGVDVVAHNLAFEMSYFEAAGIELGECHCTLQAARLTLGERSTSLADAVEAYFGIVLDKTEQVSDWSAPDLTAVQLEYAARDAVMAFKLMGKVFPALGPQTPAYEIRVAAVPAVARMGRRGVWLDGDAHAEFMRAQQARQVEAHETYLAACRYAGLMDLATKVPATPDEKREVLNAILTSDELERWARTKKSGALSTARNELKRANHYPPIKALVELSKIDKILTAFGPTLSVFVSPVTGRIHANYRVAATAAGRASCSYPNMQQAPRDKAFRALFKPEPGYKYVGADFASMELRAAAYVSGESAMIEAFREGLDLHRLTASRMLNKAPDDIADEERRAAKAVNFGAIYGSGAGRLVQTAWDQYDTVMSIDEAVRWLAAFKRMNRRFTQWRDQHHELCKESGRIVIGKDAKRGIGRFFPLSRVPAGKSVFTRCCNLPIQGACADASMLALTTIDQMLFDADIEGGPVLWLHDEVIMEVLAEEAMRAKFLLEKAMRDAFEATFPGAGRLGLLNGLVKGCVGDNWAEIKG